MTTEHKKLSDKWAQGRASADEIRRCREFDRELDRESVRARGRYRYMIGKEAQDGYARSLSEARRIARQRSRRALGDPCAPGRTITIYDHASYAPVETWYNGKPRCA